tara:strand:- start:327 stop:905 length:579 start_codon:yes stop_codon:yes gene_type:complete
MSKYLLPLLVFFLSISCGNKNEKSDIVVQKGSTPNFVDDSDKNSGSYGTRESIEEYLNKIEPLIKRYSQIQNEIYSAMGSSGVFTGRNLAIKTKEQKPALLEVANKLQMIDSPPLIAPFHKDFKHLLVLRISAFDAAIRAHELENTTGDTSAFTEVTNKFALSEEQIVKLNDQMLKINESLLPKKENKIATP